MKSKYQIITRMTFGVLAFAMLLVGLQTTMEPVCGCGPIDWAVSSSLHRIDALIQQYAAEHQGLYPTYDELKTITEQWDRQAIDTYLRFYVMRYYKDKNYLTLDEFNTVERYEDGELSFGELQEQLAGERAMVLVRQYRIEHTQYPTYDDWVEQLQSDYDDHTRLTPQVSMETRNFIVMPNHMGAIGYAVSSDQHDYVLIGAGWGEMNISLYGSVKLPIHPQGVRILRPNSTNEGQK